MLRLLKSLVRVALGTRYLDLDRLGLLFLFDRFCTLWFLFFLVRLFLLLVLVAAVAVAVAVAGAVVARVLPLADSLWRGRDRLPAASVRAAVPNPSQLSLVS